MTKGIFIIAHGRRGYGFAAWNLAFSLKKFSPDIPITLFCEAKTISQLDPNKQQVFDDILFIPDELLYPFDPCRIKTNFYDFLPYDISLFLDADSLALKDVTQCFTDFEASGLYHATHVYKTHTLDKGRDFPEMWWAWMDDIYSHYNLYEDAVFPATNSSWQFIRKGDEAKKFYGKLSENYKNPLPLDKLKNKWGGTQPDELYLNVTMAQMGFTEYSPIMFFGSQIDKRGFSELTNDYYFLSIFGAQRTTKQMYIEWYDKLMFSYCRQAIPPIAHIFKVHYINNDKHMNNPLKLPKSGNRFQPIQQASGIRPVDMQKLLPAVIPIAKTIKVDSKKLIQSYTGPKGEIVRPTNWFNCSVCEFDGKKYFAYRMERAPWTTKMKIGLCLLDDNLQPISDTNSLLHIDTDTKIYNKDFQAEDPRLFVFDNQLFISYMGIGKDGYAMGMARINTETMQAEDSFYIDKPKKNIPEKNWTFFEHQFGFDELTRCYSTPKLYAVYNTSPHTIFEMNREKWTEVYRTNFDHKWKYGIIRGGTPPQRYGDYYLSFFHSSLDFPYRGGRPTGRQYFIGAYLFEAQPPFAPVAISKEPLLAGEKMDESIPRMWNKLYVVFPNGMIRKENSWCISFGYNDYECRFVEIPDSLLEENLIYLHQKEMA